MSEAADKWKNEIVRNSEILQAHREEIDDMRKDIDLLIKSEFDEQPIEPLDTDKDKLNLSVNQEMELIRMLKDKKERVPEVTGVDYDGDNVSVTELYSIAGEGYDNKLNHLRELFEKLININTQAFACGAMTAREYNRVTKVRKEYEELMEG